MKKNKKNEVVIIGAGPAGLTAAYYLLKNTKDYKVTILEEENVAGGISKTITYHGNKMDLGGHRFFSKNRIVNDIWKEILPIQGKKSIDDKILGIEKNLEETDIDPEKEDEVLLIRNRVSRIYYDKKFFDYPINLTWMTIKKLGFIKTIKCGMSYIKSIFIKRKEENLENFYINRFGKCLYQIFFKNYTEKVWGKEPAKISPDWGSQRVKTLSIFKIITNYFTKILHLKNKKIETSLIENFYYPKYGPGQMWEEMASKIENMGGKIIYNAKVNKIYKKNNKIIELFYERKKKSYSIQPDYVLSSMPLKDLCIIMNNVEKEVMNIAKNLPYRDFIIIGLVLSDIDLKNETKIKTLCNLIPDNWIYIQEEEVKMGRIQIFNNWSPYLVHDPYNTISLGLEYFCEEGDRLWNMTDNELLSFAISELKKIGMATHEDILDYHIERVKKAYPAYFGSYNNLEVVRNYLDKIENLYPIGRNGQHHYNNMDHSMLTGIEAVKNIMSNKKGKTNIWSINAEKEYLEEKEDEKSI